MEYLDLSALSEDTRLLLEGHVYNMFLDKGNPMPDSINLSEFPQDVKEAVYAELKEPAGSQVHGAGDEFHPENPNERTAARTEAVSKEQVETVRLAFTRESLRYGGGLKSAGIDREEAKGLPARTVADSVREAFTHNK